MIYDKAFLELVEKCIGDFDQKEALKERVLQNAFSQYQIVDVDLALVRVTLLNTFYSTRLNNTISSSKTIDVESMAKRIAAKSDLEEMIRSKVAEKRMDAFRYIATGTLEGKTEEFNAAWSFASKYCSFCNNIDFPIMDSNTRRKLCELNDKYHFYSKKISFDKLGDYELFYKVHKSFLGTLPERPNGQKYTPKLIDEYLWYSTKNGL